MLSFLMIANGLPEAHAVWGLSVAPASRATAPGGTVFFTVSVTGTIAGNPNVMLLVSPPVLGFTYSFSVNNVPAPFTSVMSVTVAAFEGSGVLRSSGLGSSVNGAFPGAREHCGGCSCCGWVSV